MKAAVLRQVQTPLSVEEVEVLPPRANEVLVRLAAAGVCHSDQHVISGDLPAALPAILGHEGAGVVEAVGPGVTRVAPGDHVILLFRATCGACSYCAIGRPALCGIGLRLRATGLMPDGTSRFRQGGQELRSFAGVSCFAEYTVVLEQAVVPIRPEMPLDRAALVGCSVMTGVGAVVNRARVEPGASVLVIGAGGVGLNVVQGAALVGAEPIIAADLVPAKLELACAFGATHTIDASREDVLAATRELTHGEGVDYAFEAVGRPALISLAVEAVRRGGTAVIVGLAPSAAEATIRPQAMVLQEKALLGTIYGSTRPHHDMPRLVDLYLAGKLKLDELISRRYRLDEINEGFRAMLAGEVARGVVAF